MFRHFVLILAFIALPAPAFSLSCLVPNFAETYNRIAAAPEVYLLAEGRFVVKDRLPRIPEPGEITSRAPDITASMGFAGRHLGVQTDGELDVDVTVRVECAGPWCGRFPAQNARMLVFLERGEDGSLSMSKSPCPGDTKRDPSDEEIRALRSCMEKGRCEAPEIAVFGPGIPRVAD